MMKRGKRNPKCEYCEQPTRGQSVKKLVVLKRHIFCSEICWVLFRYGVKKDKVFLDWS